MTDRVVLEHSHLPPLSFTVVRFTVAACAIIRLADLTTCKVTVLYPGEVPGRIQAYLSQGYTYAKGSPKTLLV